MKFNGAAYLLGPNTSDHWLMYVWDNWDIPFELSTDRTLHLLMQDLDHDVAKHFFYNNSDNKNDNLAEVGMKMTKLCGLQSLFESLSTKKDKNESTILDAWAFKPCGYSMNGFIDNNTYHTIHIIPESHCS